MLEGQLAIQTHPSEYQDQVAVTVECPCLDVQKPDEVLDCEVAFSLEIHSILPKWLLRELFSIEVAANLFFPIIKRSHIFSSHWVDGLLHLTNRVKWIMFFQAELELGLQLVLCEIDAIFR